MGKIGAYFKKNIAEIEADLALRLFGVSLCLSHLATAVKWVVNDFPLILRSDPAYCWPFFQSCYALRPLSPALLNAVLVLFIIVPTAGAALFFKKSRTVMAYGFLFAATAIKFAVHSLDYRMMGNFHYMLFIIQLYFLFVLHKREGMRLLILGFYLAAGALKLNFEWLSATSVAPRTVLSGVLPRQLLEAMCAYVVVLELIFSWFLLRKNPLFFYFTFLQLAIFHAFSWHIVGFFYPVSMACLIALFLFDRWTPAPFVPGAKTPAYLAVASFIFAQIIPALTPGVSAINGEGRLFAINMFDSRSECRSQILIRRGKTAIELAPLFEDDSFGIILHCDPLILYNHAQQQCRYLERLKEPDSDIDVYLNSKPTTEDRYQRLISVDHFCSKKLSYSVFGGNSWIEK